MPQLWAIPIGILVGIANAIAGGGGLVSVPLFVLLGLSPYVAVITLSVGVVGGSVGPAIEYRHELRTRRKRIVAIALVDTIGAIAGVTLLLNTSEKYFDSIVPWLILFGTSLIILRPFVNKWIVPRANGSESKPRDLPITGMIALLFCGVYTGYYGAAVGIMLIGVLGLMFKESFRELNAEKCFAILASNVTVGIILAICGPVVWSIVFPYAAANLCGGFIGAKLARKANEALFTKIVVAMGLVGFAFVLFRK